MTADRGPARDLGGVEVDDPPLPPAWYGAAAAGIVAAVLLWLWHGVADPPGTLDRYRADRAAALDEGAMLSEETLRELAGDAMAVSAGERAFRDHCESCHGPAGEGTDVGPSLIDTAWIRESSPLAIYTTIVEGRSEAGMPPWGSLGRGTCMQITAYVLTIREAAEDGAGAAPGQEDADGGKASGAGPPNARDDRARDDHESQ